MIKKRRSLRRHCEEHLRRSNPDCLNGKILDCFAALAMTECVAAPDAITGRGLQARGIGTRRRCLHRRCEEHLRRSDPDCLNGRILDCFASLAMTESVAAAPYSASAFISL
ncbi:hypothetical protein GTH44_08430 [Bradyrhizobium japonicum]|nr:hypothetical protein [Bradyrhizobium japonicum]